MTEIADVHTALRGIRYPATKPDLLETAAGNGAGEAVLAILRALDGHHFKGPADVERGARDGPADVRVPRRG
jgi:hypothetical protein